MTFWTVWTVLAVAQVTEEPVVAVRVPRQISVGADYGIPQVQVLIAPGRDRDSRLLALDLQQDWSGYAGESVSAERFAEMQQAIQEVATFQFLDPQELHPR